MSRLARVAMEYGILDDVLAVLASAVLAVALFRRLRLPPVLGYLVTGALAGPHGLGWLMGDEDTRLLAEFGVVFLLFTVGLEFSLPKLMALRQAVLGLGGAQVVSTTLVAAAGAALLGLPSAEAFVVGGVLAMSSTALVVKQLTEQAELAAPHGRAALGILLFQDLAVLPFLIVIPVLAGASERPLVTELAWALATGGVVVTLLLGAGRWLLRPLFHEIAAARSAELFTLTALLCALAAAWATHAAGLSLALGGFIAGMMLGETEFRHQVEADIRPFRDVLLGLFFVSIGTVVDLAALPHYLPAALALVVALVLFKAASITLLCRWGGVSPEEALRTGVILAHGGEFGFALVSLALGVALLEAAVSQVLIAALTLSLLLAPLEVRHSRALARLLLPAARRPGGPAGDEALREQASGLHGHVLICGFGRIGQSIARFVEREGLAFVALDLDPLRVRDARTAGEPVAYGDATHMHILQAAGVQRARVLVVSFDDPDGAMTVLAKVRGAQLDLPILVRTRDDSALERLQRAGATEVVPETLEASLMLAAHLMLLLDIPLSQVLREVQEVRRTRYRMLRGFFLGQELQPLDRAPAYRERLYTVALSAAAQAVGRRLGELQLERVGVLVTAVRRGGIRGEQPQANMRLRPGDVLVLYGVPEDLERAERVLLGG